MKILFAFTLLFTTFLSPAVQAQTTTGNWDIKYYPPENKVAWGHATLGTCEIEFLYHGEIEMKTISYTYPNFPKGIDESVHLWPKWESYELERFYSPEFVMDWTRFKKSGLANSMRPHPDFFKKQCAGRLNELPEKMREQFHGAYGVR